MSHTETDQQVKPWHREYYVWLVIFFPLLAVVAGIYTIHLAITSNDGLVVDDYYKQGLEINRTLERDKNANQFDLLVDVQLVQSLQEVVITLTANNSFQYPETIEARFLNATRAGLDQTVNMIRTERGIYRGQLPELTTGKWYLQLEQEDWRLVKQLQF